MELPCTKVVTHPCGRFCGLYASCVLGSDEAVNALLVERTSYHKIVRKENCAVVTEINEHCAIHATRI